MALAVGAAIAAAPLIASGRFGQVEAVLAVAALIALVQTLAGIGPMLPWALLFLGGSTTAAYAYGDLGRIGVALSAAGLLIVAETASAADDLRPVERVEATVIGQLAGEIAVAGAVGCAAAAAVLAAASLGSVGGVTGTTVGGAAAVLLIGLVASLALVRGHRRQGEG